MAKITKTIAGRIFEFSGPAEKLQEAFEKKRKQLTEDAKSTKSAKKIAELTKLWAGKDIYKFKAVEDLGDWDRTDKLWARAGKVVLGWEDEDDYNEEMGKTFQVWLFPSEDIAGGDWVEKIKGSKLSEQEKAAYIAQYVSNPRKFITVG